MSKNIYFRNDKIHAVAVINNRRLATMLLENGFSECSNEEYFTARWTLWNDTAIADIEEKEKKKVKP